MDACSPRYTSPPSVCLLSKQNKSSKCQEAKYSYTHFPSHTEKKTELYNFGTPVCLFYPTKDKLLIVMKYAALEWSDINQLNKVFLCNAALARESTETRV